MSDDRARADEELRLAVQRHAHAMGYAEDGEMVSEFVVVSAWLTDDPDEDVYVLQSPGCTTHSALGLLEQGKQRALS